MIYFTPVQIQHVNFISSEKNMILSENGINLIKKYEGLYLKAYLCPAGLPTISYGVNEYPNGIKVKLGDIITKDQAEEYFNNYVDKLSKQVFALVKDLNLNQNQFDAIVSLAFNIGINGFKNSTLLRLLKNNKVKESSMEFIKWNKATIHGVKIPLKGLTKRRLEEAELFNKIILE